MGGRTNNPLVCAPHSVRRAGRWRVFVRECHLCAERKRGKAARHFFSHSACVLGSLEMRPTYERERGRREREKLQTFGKRCFISSTAPFVVCRFTHIIFCFLVACQFLWAERQLGRRFAYFFICSLCWNNMYANTHRSQTNTLFLESMRETHAAWMKDG